MNRKLQELKELREKLNLIVTGAENYPDHGPSLIISNHNCLMDIFALPCALKKATVSLISPRLIYKPVVERKETVERYLYALPMEAHGGTSYAELCLRQAVEVLKEGMNVNIFPEGAYVKENQVVYRGRTGMARILVQCMDQGIYPNLVPVSIEIKNMNPDLDCYVPNGEQITISILKAIDYQKEYEEYKRSQTFEVQNLFLHKITDKGMRSIADTLEKTYCLDYIPLFAKGNVMFEDGKTVLTEEANQPFYLQLYQHQLENRAKILMKEIKNV